MYGVIKSAALYGINGQLISIEIDISPGLPIVHIVGLPDASVHEAIDRVRSTVRNNGWKFPLERITISFAPADVKKEGSSFDLGIAVALLVTSGQRVDIYSIAKLEQLRKWELAAPLAYVNTDSSGMERHEAMTEASSGAEEEKPGEVSLAHRGILFLDELPEFPKTST